VAVAVPLVAALALVGGARVVEVAAAAEAAAEAEVAGAWEAWARECTTANRRKPPRCHPEDS